MKNLFRIQTIAQVFFICLTIISLTNCGADNNADGKKVSDKILNMDKTISDAVESTAKGVTNAVENTAEGIADVVETTAEGVADVVETAAEGAAGMVEKSANKIENAANSATNIASKTAQAAKDKANQMKNDAMKKASDVKSDAMAMADPEKVKSKATETATTMKSTSQPSKAKAISTASNATTTKPAIKKATEVVTNSSKPAPVGADHGSFDQLLRKHVSSTGVVDYAGIKSDISKLDAYLESLRQNPVKSNWPKDKQLAYWINAYNANTIKLILNNYPVQKITDLEGGKPWDKVWIKLGDKTYSLNNIENDIIRPEFNEPRIHFAVNCAAKSCPPLLNRAWTVANLESNFVSQTKAFINNPNYNKISASSASLSKIFEWYGEDFGDVRTFLNKYSDTTLSAKSNLTFKEYDWNLNGK